MNSKLLLKIEKIKALIKQGVGGESVAAREALNRLIEKHNLNPAVVEDQEYRFKYSTVLEERLLVQLSICLFGGKISFMRDTWHKRELVAVMEYTDYVSLDCAYEYFRRHMKQEWNKHCLPLIRRKRTTRTKNLLREQLQEAFFSKYIIESKLYLENQLTRIDHSKLSKNEMEARMTVSGVKGGKYNKQINHGLFLE